jgi:hypothetical protein
MPSTELVKYIIKGEVNEFYADYLKQLDQKLKNIALHKDKPIEALHTVSEELDKLKTKVFVSYIGRRKSSRLLIGNCKLSKGIKHKYCFDPTEYNAKI